MSTTTPNIGLFKYDVTNDATTAFSITNALNNNWDKIDTAIATSSGVSTNVSGTTWYRIWNDGWKEQGGQVSLSETEIEWTQPLISTNGTIGGNSFAVYPSSEYTSTFALHYAFDGSALSSSWQNGSSTAPWFIVYNPEPIRIYGLDMWQTTYNIHAFTNFTIKGSNDNSSYSLIGSYTATNTSVGTQNSFSPVCSNYYKYYKFEFTGSYVNVAQFQMKAKQKTSVANSITFPIAFTNTNYSYTFACQDGGGLDAYVSNKTTTGMTLTSTNSGSASWTACGY